MRGLLPRILLLAVTVVLGCSTSDSPTTNTGLGFLNNNGNDCTQHTHLTVSIDEPAPPAAQLRIESCRVDQDACMDLCVYALTNLSQYPEWMGGVTPPQLFGGGALPPGGQFPTNTTPQFSPSLCKVTFDGSTANAEIAIDTPKFGPGCAVEAGTADGSGSGAGGAPSPGGL